MFPLFQAYRWCIEAMKEITPGLPVKVVVDVLRQASKVSALPMSSRNSIEILCGRLRPPAGRPCLTRVCAAGLRCEEGVQESGAAD